MWSTLPLYYHYALDQWHVLTASAQIVVTDNSMAKVGILVLLLLVSTGFIITVADAQSCNACNCQFNNIQILSQLVEAEVNRKLADEPSK